MSDGIEVPLARVRAVLAEHDLSVVDEDLERPWGGFIVIAPTQVGRFIETFLGAIERLGEDEPDSLSPKILFVAPGRRLSWQYHRRRAELWRVLEGPVGVGRSDDDREHGVDQLAAGALVRLGTGVRHRLIGLGGWGIVAEVWQHTDRRCPSDESDIVRLQDDYART